MSAAGLLGPNLVLPYLHQILKDFRFQYIILELSKTPKIDLQYISLWDEAFVQGMLPKLRNLGRNIFPAAFGES